MDARPTSAVAVRYRTAAEPPPEGVRLRAHREAIANRALHSLSITCFGYASGQSVSFFEGRTDIEPWTSGRQAGACKKIGADHLMASSALPLFFPAVKLNREYFG